MVAGPTVSLWGGNHGDEYEGPVVLGQLARELDPAAVEGRLIILPTINPPALLAGTRVSAIDGKNMNRVWPGDRNGTITERIVSWLDREVLPQTDVLMDLHTGGNAIDLIPMSMCHLHRGSGVSGANPRRPDRLQRASERRTAPRAGSADGVGPGA